MPQLVFKNGRPDFFLEFLEEPYEPLSFGLTYSCSEPRTALEQHLSHRLGFALSRKGRGR